VQRAKRWGRRTGCQNSPCLGISHVYTPKFLSNGKGIN
jgi:hypothetical protein